MSSVASTPEPLLQMTEINKSFPGIRALHSIDLSLDQGEVLALLGENGAGKSTLIKILGGAHKPDSGEIRIDGIPVEIDSPHVAIQSGIGIIYQELNLVPALTARENIFLGREKTTAGLIRQRDDRKEARETFQKIGLEIPLDVPCGQLSIAQQQVVEIAKTVSQNVRLLVMDEPTAALSEHEVSRLFAIVRDLKSLGIGVIYISHRLEEIFEIADRVMFLRDGEYVGQASLGDLSRQRMIEMMVGRPVEDEFPKRSNTIGPPGLQVKGLTRGRAVRNVCFDVGRGEVLGITGLVGAGRTETVRLIFGADTADAGTIYLDGRQLQINTPRDAIHAGICLLTEDRKNQGLVLGLSVRQNFGLPNLRAFSAFGFVNQQKEENAFAKYIESLNIRIAHQQQLAGNLSGGNQQKVVLAKWLERNSEVIIFDEPTRGIDVGAKYEIYLLINRLASQGKAIIIISSELLEVLGMSDRILVMREGYVTGQIDDVASATQEQIMHLAIRKNHNESLQQH